MFLFLSKFLFLQYRFSILINLISLVTPIFPRLNRNAVLQLSLSLQFLKYEQRHEISNNVTF